MKSRVAKAASIYDDWGGQGGGLTKAKCVKEAPLRILSIEVLWMKGAVSEDLLQVKVMSTSIRWCPAKDKLAEKD